jgi:formyltetrahydrofolate deformylase
MSEPNPQTLTLVISCPDTTGVVADTAAYIAELGGSMQEANHHTDVSERWFFMRNVIDTSAMKVDADGFRTGFANIAEKYQMTWYVRDSTVKQKVVLLASQSSHCLNDLLHRWQTGELDCDIPAVISNHEKLRSMVEWHDIPFHHVPVPKTAKAKAFTQMAELIDAQQADCIVLARYMQILPPDLCRAYQGKMINIHHSFLPSFIGADPYQKAYDRGVKLIGATSHYVTEDLDEGPIIEQDVIRVSHSSTKADMVRLGRDVERAVLARGLRYHLDDRVLIHGNKTVVFA